MRHRSSGNSLLCLVLAAASLYAAPPQDNRAAIAPPANLMQILKDGYAALQRKDYDAARDASLRALDLDSKNQYAWSYLGRAYDMLGQLPQSEEAYRTLVGINPRHASAYASLGVVIRKQGREDEAIANFRKQLEITPRSRYAAANLSRALAFQRKWEEALPFAAMVTEIAPNEPNEWHHLGTMQIKSGQVDQARRSFDRALALPHEPMLENSVAYELADAHVDLDRSWTLISGALEKTAPLLCEPKALSDGDRCTTQLRQIALMLDTAGWVLYRQGKVKEAEPYLRSAFAITPRGEHELHMIVLLAKSGRLDEAVKLFAEVRTHPNFEHADSREAVREVTAAAGGETRLEALLDRAEPLLPDAAPQAKVIAMVDGKGNIVGVETSDPSSPGAAQAAKSLTLPALSWPGYALRSIRSIELQRTDGQWSLAQSYVGTTPPPPPCGVAIPNKLPVLITERNTPGTQPAGCAGDF